MSISSLVTRGFSNGSFVGSIAEAVTMGYSIAVQVEIIGFFEIKISVTNSYSFDESVLKALSMNASVT